MSSLAFGTGALLLRRLPLNLLTPSARRQRSNRCSILLLWFLYASPWLLGLPRFHSRLKNFQKTTTNIGKVPLALSILCRDYLSTRISIDKIDGGSSLR